MIYGRFTNRSDAGRRLAAKLMHLTEQDPVVLALPRGGVAVGFEVARALKAPLDLVLVRKIGAPFQSELAIGALANGGHVETVLNRGLAELVSDEWLREAKDQQLEEMERRRVAYLQARPRIPVEGRTAILVDDGIATGATMRAALRSVRRATPRRLVLAVPIAPPAAVSDLTAEVDEVVCLHTPSSFGAIGNFYEDFRQLDDADVIRLLDAAEREFASHRRGSD
jgi:putative phosphoribosyl transferase